MTQEPPPATAPPMAMDTGKGRKAKKEKAPKAPRAKKEKAPKMPAQRGGNSDLFAINAPTPSREELEREAAAELNSVLSPSYELLHREMPDAASPDDAQQRIHGKLGRVIADNDAELPKHPLYTGDTLVYYQLRRHYGKPHSGGSQVRSWYPS